MVRDFVICALLGLLSLAVGLLVNRLRAEPLPLMYQTPGERAAERAGPSRVTLIDFSDAAEAVFGGEILVLDARPRAFYERGHLPGARNLSRKQFADDLERLRSSLADVAGAGGKVLLYCANRNCPDAAWVSEKLLSEYPDLGGAVVYEEGWEEWEASGQPIEEGPKP